MKTHMPAHATGALFLLATNGIGMGGELGTSPAPIAPAIPPQVQSRLGSAVIKSIPGAKPVEGLNIPMPEAPVTAPSQVPGIREIRRQ